MKPNLKNPALLLICMLLFSAVAMAQPPNDNCTSAKLIVTDSTCVTGTSRYVGETLTAATDGGYNIPSACAMLSNSRDVWYKFVAKTKIPTITISNVGAGWGGVANVRIQLLSGSCGVSSFTEVACATGATLTPSLTSPLTEGNTYYIRIHRNNSAIVPVNYTFDICVTDALSKASRMNEVFSRTVLSAANVLQYPWEVTYGPDDNLWITEARGYKVYKMDPNTGVKTTVLDLSTGSNWFGSTQSDTLEAINTASWTGAIGWPQGGFAGLALHPKFLDGSGTADYVYVSYVHRYISGASPSGIFFRNKLVRFTYNSGTNRLGSPAVLCDTLPGSSDHNSQRMIIAPVIPGGPKYLFYANGDMGAGQFGNRDRVNKAQNPNSYEGKILRFNLDTVGGLTWIPATNPFSANSAVYSIGIRNNQGFAYDTSLNILYGASHGPYSDDEINIIQKFKNYGHPLVIGYADGNYNGTLTPSTNTSISAGAPFTDNNGNSACPAIGNEVTRMNAINAAAATTGPYKGPLFSAYATPAATIANTWATNPGNAGWYSEAWSGLDLYSNKIIPAWKRSLIAAGLKWGRLIKLQLGATGVTTLPSNLDSLNTADTITYFQSTNRYRDLAFAPNGKDIFLIMDNTSATSGPGVGNPTVPACPGCVIKYSFLGYADAAGFSTIPKSVDVADGTVNTCNNGTPVTIDGTNNFLWVPVTGPDGNIMAEINCMGQSLGLITSAFYKQAPTAGAVRVANGIPYLDRNITITPTVTSFAIPVKVRLYISAAEFDSLKKVQPSIVDIRGLRILKNNDPCSAAIGSSTTLLTPTNTLVPDLTQGANGYVLQTPVSTLTSFYFAANNVVLPLDIITFTGSLQGNLTTLLKWKTENEINTAYFAVERSIDNINFSGIGTVKANGNSSNSLNYTFIDLDAANQRSTVVYYRLKIFDLNNSYKYSNVINISIPVTKGMITVSPNPAFEELRATVISPVTGNEVLQITDNTGRVMMYNSIELKKGNNNVTINISRLAAGTYYFNIVGADINLKTKFQKQ